MIEEGKSLKDEETLGSLEINNGCKLYFKDLGIKQIFNLSLSFSFYIVLQLILSILQLMSESFALFVGPQISWTTVSNLAIYELSI